METEIMTVESKAEIIERVLITGDLAKLQPQERVNYYRAVCESVGLNPMTQPFAYIQLSGKLVLYAKKDCTDQLRRLNRVSIIKLEHDAMQGVYVITAYASLPDGRRDSSTGIVNIENLKGDMLANAMMKAETKAKRRVTLSICGLGFLDESEIETTPAKQVDVKENGDLGPTWTEYPATKSEIELAKPTAQTPMENGKPASLKFQAFVTWANEWVRGNGKDYANADGRVNMHHLLSRIGILGFSSVTAENADDIKAALESYVKGKVDTQ